MPEKEGERAAETAAVEASTAGPEEETSHSTTRGGDAVEFVSWPLEDPSEYRPEFAPGGSMDGLGKKKDDFRVYCEVWPAVTHVRCVK